ncbi:DUF6766 family protein [Saccharothrix coeruleofusca]|uniref:Uncharacterized protein n=1 Tax=Saccharothrix coeruleofusca TaxID=33919 RepID=A0A918EF75_9PSEU|nr:DUF6766 family protein [Saccharothrix coeruleofusca]MBP2335285.1 hypothetical protein [Saccharothrix coeruleofusca]GGP71972.1 hypothetical protein GCM10010185_51660 [Saccharothrix coeruleofusca]
MRRFLRDNGLGLAFGSIFLVSLVGQAFSGNSVLNDRRLTDGGDTIGLWQYVTSSEFAVDVAENWQSEYLQFFLFIFATVWLMQRGSPESKPARRLGAESDEEQSLGAHATAGSPPWARAGGWRTALYSNSLGLAMLVLFLASWFTQSVAGRSAYNNERLVDFQDPVSWGEYVLSADFWNRSLQNWQSEFLAIGSMAVLSVYLRQRGSPESKPVGTPHDTTDEAG